MKDRAALLVENLSMNLMLPTVKRTASPLILALSPLRGEGEAQTDFGSQCAAERGGRPL
jgi:hypothetical protein